MAQYHPTRIVKQRSREDGSSTAERMLWSSLSKARSHGLLFRRNQPIDGYVVDFFCARAGVAVELGADEQSERIGRYLRQKGYSVFQVGHKEAGEDPVGIVAEIVDRCKDLVPSE